MFQQIADIFNERNGYVGGHASGKLLASDVEAALIDNDYTYLDGYELDQVRDIVAELA